MNSPVGRTLTTGNSFRIFVSGRHVSVSGLVRSEDRPNMDVQLKYDSRFSAEKGMCIMFYVFYLSRRILASITEPSQPTSWERGL